MNRESERKGDRERDREEEIEKGRHRNREKQGYLQIVNMREDNLIIFENSRFIPMRICSLSA